MTTKGKRKYAAPETTQIFPNEAPMNDGCVADTGMVKSGSDDGTVPESTNPEGTNVNTETTELDAVPEGYTQVMNPVPEAAKTKQEIAAEKAQAKIAAKAAKAEAAAKAKADREAAAAAKAEAAGKTKEERAAAHAERLARLAELNPDGTRKYTGSMLSLADRVKQGAYVKSATGQLRSTDELAQALDAVPVMNVIALAKIVLNLDSNPYAALNTGQQSMNLRNKLRGAITKGTLTLERVKEVIAEEGFATAVDWAAEKEAKKVAREAAAAAAKAAKEAKAAAKVEAGEPEAAHA